jgi:hypothetical protein
MVQKEAAKLRLRVHLSSEGDTSAGYGTMPRLAAGAVDSARFDPTRKTGARVRLKA